MDNIAWNFQSSKEAMLRLNSDLKIKTVGDQVEINAKHNEKQDAEGSVW